MFESKGIKRTLSSLFAVAACAADVVPVLAPYKELLIQFSGLFGAVGVAHAALSNK